MQSMSDRLFNAYDEKTKAWGQIYEDEGADGRSLLRRRNAYYKARKELTEYITALDRTVTELDSSNAALVEELRATHDNFADVAAELRKVAHERNLLRSELDVVKNQFATVSKHLEDRNRQGEKGPDQIGIEYIQRLGIPELTEVFNRVVLGRS